MFYLRYPSLFSLAPSSGPIRLARTRISARRFGRTFCSIEGRRLPANWCPFVVVSPAKKRWTPLEAIGSSDLATRGCDAPLVHFGHCDCLILKGHSWWGAQIRPHEDNVGMLAQSPHPQSHRLAVIVGYVVWTEGVRSVPSFPEADHSSFAKPCSAV